jgi:hypothetical protein
VPNGRYYLGDAGYVNTPAILTPLRRTRYHLREQYTSRCRPETYKELFNLRHSSLRNEIKRIFGVLKRRFPFLKTAMEYNLLTQTRVIFAACALHNFIHKQGIIGDIFENGEGGEDEKLTAEEEAEKKAGVPEDPAKFILEGMDLFRQEVGDRMLQDYNDYNKRKTKNRN